MKNIFIVLSLLLSANAFAFNAEIVTLQKCVAASVTPEALTASTTKSQDVVIQADSGNTQPVKVGLQADQHIELPAGAVLALSDIVTQGSERFLDLNKIYVEVAVNGECVNVLYTKLK